MSELRFTVWGKPQPKQRARKGRPGRDGKAHWYTPSPTVVYENAVRIQYANACRGRRGSGIPRLEVWAYFPNRRRADADNVLKSVQDALNGKAWPDDSDLADVAAHRRFDIHWPRTEIVLTWED